MKTHPRFRYWVPAVLWAVLIFVLSSIPGHEFPPFPEFIFRDKLVHICEYAVFGYLLSRAFYGGVRFSLSLRFFVLVVALALIYGILDEFYQSFVPCREMEPADVFSDGLGASLGCLAYFIRRRVFR